MLMSESQRSEFMARVLRKEYLARLCEQGKIAPEEYVQAVNVIRAAEQLPPLTLADTLGMPRPRRRSNKSSQPFRQL